MHYILSAVSAWKFRLVQTGGDLILSILFNMHKIILC